MKKKYKINEIFYSIQGEGVFTGQACIFIRFSGCNLKCKFCDTKHESFKEMTARQIVKAIKKYPCKKVILTGGEPALQIDDDIIFYLKDKWIRIETNGTKIIPYNVWKTCSPKRETGYKMDCDADEIKIIWDGKFNSRILNKFLHVRYKFIQPEGNKKEFINKAIQYIKKYPEWRLSLQCQKLINIK